MTKTKFSRRDFLRVGSAAAAGTILAACGGAAAPAAEQPTAAPAAPAAEQPAAPAPAGEGVTVQWWTDWGNLKAAVNKMQETPQFKEMMGKNKLEYKDGAKPEVVLTAVAGGTPPDGGSNMAYANLFTRGATIPVDDRVSASTVIKKDNYLPPIWDAGFLNGKMMGVICLESFINYGLNYNSDAVTKAGLDPAKPPETWEDTLTWHKALTKFDDAGDLKQFGLDPYDAMAGEPDFSSLSFGGFNWWDEQNRKFRLDDPAMAQCFDMSGEFVKIIGPDKLAGLRTDSNMGGWGASYNAGVQEIMIIEGYWHPGETFIQKPEIAKFNMATWAPVPASRKGSKIQSANAHFVVLFKDGKHPDEMFKIAEFLLGDTALDIIFKEVGWITGLAAWLKKVDPNTFPGLKFYIDSATTATEWLTIRRCPIHPYVVDQFKELREKVYRGEMTGKDAAAEMQKRAEAEWKAQGLS